MSCAASPSFTVTVRVPAPTSTTGSEWSVTAAPTLAPPLIVNLAELVIFAVTVVVAFVAVSRVVRTLSA